MRQTIEQVILNNVTPVAITSSTNATPSVVTATSHGLVVGDRVLIQGHVTNTAINGIFKVTAATGSTFTLGDEISGADVAANGVGGTTGFCMKAPAVVYSESFKAIDFTVIMDTTPTMTVTPYISNGIFLPDQSSPRWALPNMGATISKTNPYEAVNFADSLTGGAISGSTGIATAGTVTNKNYEANINGAKFFTAFPSAWTAGRVSVIARCYYF